MRRQRQKPVWRGWEINTTTTTTHHHAIRTCTCRWCGGDNPAAMAANRITPAEASRVRRCNTNQVTAMLPCYSTGCTQPGRRKGEIFQDGKSKILDFCTLKHLRLAHAVEIELKRCPRGCGYIIYTEKGLTGVCSLRKNNEANSVACSRLDAFILRIFISRALSQSLLDPSLLLSMHVF